MLLPYLAVLAAAQTAPTSLLVEYLSNPLGIATLAPRFSWVPPNSDQHRNISQLSYRLIICSNEKNALEGVGDVFDSGLVVSSRTIGVPYSGPPLEAGQRYYWAVLCETVSASAPVPVASSWSVPAMFSTGLQSLTDWFPSTSFIGMASAPLSACPWLRTSVQLSEADVAAVKSGAASAFLHVASVGYHQPFVNGMNLAPEQALAPSVSDLSRRILTRVYDASLALSSGTNVIGLWLAPGWAMFEGVNPVMSYNLTKYPLVMAEIRLRPAPLQPPGSTPNLTLGTSAGGGAAGWVFRLSNTQHLGAATNSNWGGDAVDYRKDLPGWATTAVKTNDWEPATAFTLPGPPRAVTPEAVEPMQVVATVPVTRVQSLSSGVWGVTFSTLFTGVLQLDPSVFVGLPQGAVVNLSYGTQEGLWIEERGQLDSVIVGGGSPTSQGFKGRFSYHQFQHVAIAGLSAPPDPGEVSGLQLLNARPRVGSFNCSNPLLTSIYQAFVRTYEAISVEGMVTDSPYRERLGYGADAMTSFELATATYSSIAFYERWLQDWVDVQGWNSDQTYPVTPNTAPTVDGGGGPAWGGFSVALPLHLFEITGDEKNLQRAYPAMVRWAEWYLPKVNSVTGLLQPWWPPSCTTPLCYWNFLGDWLAPHGSDDSQSLAAVFFNTCYFSYALSLIASAATSLNNTAAATRYASSAANLSAAVHATFWKNDTGTYFDGRQGRLVMALLSNVPPPSLRPRVVAALVAEIEAQTNHFDTGLLGNYFLTKVLTHSSIARHDKLYAMVTAPTAPSYAAILGRGRNTFCEDWFCNTPAAQTPSNAHSTLLGPALWIPQGLLGVGPGGRSFSLRPAFSVGGVVSAAGSVWTPLGVITVEWSVGVAKLPGGEEQQRSSCINLTLSIPPNAVGEVWIPADGPEAVSEGGSPATNVLGVIFLRQEGNLTVWALGSGNFFFRALSS